MKKKNRKETNPMVKYTICFSASVILTSDIRKYDIAITGKTKTGSKKSKCVSILLSICNKLCLNTFIRPLLKLFREAQTAGRICPLKNSFKRGQLLYQKRGKMTFTCKEEGRVDSVMSKELEISRSQIEKFIKNLGIEINNKKINKPSFKVQIDDIVKYKFKDIIEKQSEYEVDFDVDILYEDDDLLVINKPPFLTVHGAPSVKEATLVDWLKKKGISLSTISGEERHGIVHRIDKQTSGALVVAKNNETHINLSKQLEDKSMGRYYLAIIDLPLKDNTVVQKPIARDRKNRLKMAVCEDGKFAKSAFSKLLLSKNEKYELIAAKLFTGRTHQIRVHLNSLSRHILGDSLYGFKSQKGKINRVMLHAFVLYLKHPRSGKFLQIEAPLIDDFRDVLYKYFNKEDIHENIQIDTVINSFTTSF